MRATIYLSLVAMLGLIGCGPTTTTDNTGTRTPATNPGVAPVVPDNGTTGGTTPPAGGAAATPGAATTDGTVGVDDNRPDNTSVNKRDRNADTKTPIDQDENQDDVNLTATIRKTIVNTEGMSVNARNVKIITSKGKVTLRGPVASAEEKEKIEKFAKDAAGEGNVTSELEVAE